MKTIGAVLVWASMAVLGAQAFNSMIRNNATDPKELGCFSYSGKC